MNSNAYLCLQRCHPWRIIGVNDSVIYRPDTSFAYVRIENWRCAGCGLIKARMRDRHGLYLSMYKYATGLRFEFQSAGTDVPTQAEIDLMIDAQLAAIREKKGNGASRKATNTSRKRAEAA